MDKTVSDILGDIIEQLEMFIEKLNKVLEQNKKSEGDDELEYIRQILIVKSREGKEFEIKELLKMFGADKLSDVPKENYEELFYMANKL